MEHWAVYRLDYNSNEFLVEKGLTKSEAEAKAAEYLAHGHHQHYWVDKEPPGGVDAVKLLSTMLSSGSTHKLAIRVLLAQGISPPECVKALDQCSSLGLDQCQQLVSEIAASDSR